MQKIKPQIHDFMKYSNLLWEMVIRDLRIKYRRSVLGYLWSLLNPLLMMLVMTLVFSHIFRFDIENFPVYLMCGSLIFNFFAEATQQAENSIILSSGLIKKVYIPKYIFPVSRVLSSFITTLFSIVALFIIIFITGVRLTPAVLLLPLPLIYVFVFATGVGLIMSTVAVFFRDAVHLYSVFITALMYFTPIFYPVTALPDRLILLIRLNPIYHFITITRKIVLSGQIPSMQQNLLCIALSVGFLAAGLIVFKKNQHKFILYI